MQKIYLTQKLVETELLEQEGFTSFILNKDSGVLIYGVTETVKDEIKKPRRQISCSFASILAASLVQPVIHLVVKGISGRGVKIAGRGYIDKHFHFSSIL